MIQQYILDRAKHSHYAANYDLRLLKALINHAIRIKIIKENPVDGVPFLPVEKKTKYVPPVEDIDKVIAMADPDTQDYLWVIRESMGRMGEINRLTWNDVDLMNRFVTLYTRKKKGGHLTPRKVPMTGKLYEILSRRYQTRVKEKPWVFWVRYWCRKTNQWKEGPYHDRKKIMGTLCRKAGVKYFRFHALRHAGASIVDNSNVPIVAIQEILGHENRMTTEIYLTV
jgi:integrase